MVFEGVQTRKRRAAPGIHRSGVLVDVGGGHAFGVFALNDQEFVGAVLTVEVPEGDRGVGTFVEIFRQIAVGKGIDELKLSLVEIHDFIVSVKPGNGDFIGVVPVDIAGIHPPYNLVFIAVALTVGEFSEPLPEGIEQPVRKTAKINTRKTNVKRGPIGDPYIPPVKER